MAQRKLNRPQMPAQRGPNCGLYALVAVARALNSGAYGDLYATYGDRPANVRPGQTPSLRYTAKRLNVNNGIMATQIGEIFSASAMRTLATHIGLNAAIVSNSKAWTPLIKAAIDINHYLLAPFGVNDEGKPQRDGNSAHWCVIFGYKENTFSQNTAYVVHWGREYEFGTSDVRKSSLALRPFQENWHKIGKNLRFAAVGANQVPVHAGGQNGGGGGNANYANRPQFAFNADLPNNLAGQMVEVWR
jgi:hypothetical protein